MQGSIHLLVISSFLRKQLSFEKNCAVYENEVIVRSLFFFEGFLQETS